MPDKELEATILAAAHYRVEPGIREIYRVLGPQDAEASPSEPIKLLEVNVDTIPAGVMPLGFGPLPTSGIHFPSIIIEVTPDEFDRIQNAELLLPSGWVLGGLMPRSANTGAT